MDLRHSLFLCLFLCEKVPPWCAVLVGSVVDYNQCKDTAFFLNYARTGSQKVLISMHFLLQLFKKICVFNKFLVFFFGNSFFLFIFAASSQVVPSDSI